MANARSSKTWSRLLRIVVPGLAVALLAGCATGYAYVQPQAPGSGSYYTSEARYSGRGYYDAYGTGPYYFGTAGFGYYGGTWPYYDPFGWYGRFGYGPWLGLGFSRVWNFPGYWGPWYSPRPTYWYRCKHHHCDRGHHSADNPKDLGVVSVRPTLPSQRPKPQSDVDTVRVYHPATVREARMAAFEHERFIHAPRPASNTAAARHPVRSFQPRPALQRNTPPAPVQPSVPRAVSVPVQPSAPRLAPPPRGATRMAPPPPQSRDNRKTRVRQH